ncbi:CoA-disulfide reductase [Deltaproteobacteria bacterium Smac51]|nr:CoA-disulfide reductase [Deltaproteobacteria bacterium Smac51]
MKVVVIGGVAAGMSAASKLKRNLKDGVDIVVYEKGEEVSFGACGIPFYVSGKIKEASELVERTPAQFAENGIDVKIRHEVTAVDPAKKTVTVRNLDSDEIFVRNYDKLIVGSGAGVRRIPPLDVPRPNLMEVRDVEDGRRLRDRLQGDDVKNVVLVGAGFIGLEMAEACAKHGKKVTVVEFAPRILSVMDQEITDRLAEEMKNNGVDVLVDSKVSEVKLNGQSISAVVIESGGQSRDLATDLVVNCAGIVPNTGFIDVQKAGNGAIIVNEKMETSLPDVYAAGDCSIMNSSITGQPQYSPLGTNANKQGRIIAELLAGKPLPQFKLIGCSALRLFGLDAAKVGLSEREAQSAGVDYKTNLITGNSYASYYGTEKITVKLVYEAKTRRILGAQLVGQGVVVARANYYAIAIRAGLTVDEFGFLDMCYSPPFGGVWDVTLIAANTAK